MEPRRPDDEPLYTDFLDDEPIPDDEEPTVSELNVYDTITDKEREEMHDELNKLEDEIATLKQVLASKEKRQWELKQCLGLSPLSELRQNLSRSWNDVQSTTVYKKTSETLNTAGQKTSVAFNTLGTAISRRIGDMSYSIHHSVSMPSMRNSSGFKSFEERVESTVSNIKSKVSRNGSGGSFEEVLSSTAQACTQAVPTNNFSDTKEFP